MSYSTTVPPPQILDRDVVEKPLFCGPGPADVHPSVIKAVAGPVITPMCEEYWQVVKDIRNGLKYLFQTNSDYVLAVSGSGHSGMETVITNLVGPGETILIANRGMWDIRASIIANRFGCKVEEVKVPLGKIFSLGLIEEAIKKTKPKALFITHGDSSTGTVQHLEGFGDLCHKYGVLLLVDTVVSIGAEPFFMDRWGVDAVYGSAQKSLSGPAGICGVAYSKMAEQVIRTRTHFPPYYLDCKELAGNWNCFGETRSYHHTLSPPMLYALRTCLKEVVNETLEKAWARHSRVQQYFIKRLMELGFGLFVDTPKDRLVCLTTVTLPRQYDYMEIVKYMRTKHNIVIFPGIGPTAGKMLRVGLMGINASITTADQVVNALADTKKTFTKSNL